MSDKIIFSNYIKELTAVARQGDAREESFYPALAVMLKDVAEENGQAHVRVTTLPKATDAGNPDFRMWNGTDRIIGYVEAKKPTEENLDQIENSEQLKRYRSTFPNMILTNFLEFRLYRNGVCIEKVLAARPMVLNQLKTTPPLEKPDELSTLLKRFLDFSLPKVFTAESLATELAKRTRFLRDVVEREMGQEKSSGGMLGSFYEAFQTYLIGTLTLEGFADLFSQTIAYGMFAARIRAGEGFNRTTAFNNIPHTIGVLRDLFRFISLGDLPEQMAWCVDDIAEVLAVADAHGILDAYYKQGKGGDPIVHFYETFLAQYDPAERERRGVYYTPEPVVSYIVRSLHGLLKTHFGKADGLASEGVTLLDPAAGTMTFIAKAAQLAVDEFVAKYGSGGKTDFIRQHIIKDFYAFELMMAPYAVGHLKMGFFLEELGHRLADDERMPFYLTNTLDNEELEQSKLPGLTALAEESRLAGVVKKQTPILVILGNPPYSGISTNTGEWIRGLIEDYKYVDGHHFGERKHWLQDDYVKFLRFAQWKIEQAGRGMAGMITNHGYLDNPTFRGMRQNLLHAFDEIYVLNLHGNALKKEICPDGSPDKNVFDIRQGVAIAFFIKHGGEHESDAIVQYADMWGLREEKYDWLSKHDQSKTGWVSLEPKSPYYLFSPRDEEYADDYQKFFSIPEVFPINSVGIVTARDKLTIQWTADEVWKTVIVFSRMEPELARQGYNLGKDAQEWKVELAQKDLQDSGPSKDKITPILYRPFDIRHTYYTGRSRGFLCRPLHTVMHNMETGKNLALLFVRQVKTNPNWGHCFVANRIIESCIISNKTSEIGYLAPLYLYPDPNRIDLFSQLEPQIRQPNLKPELVTSLADAYGKQHAPEEIFHYVYAVLYAPAYREKYAEFLRMDFPRVPFTADAGLFEKYAALGARLTALHLLNSPELDTPACRFNGQGDNRVGRGKQDGLRFDSVEQRVYINAAQYFAPIPTQVWAYQIGGYQVCEKWLKDRRDRRLELADIQTYCRIVTALGETIEIQKEIDQLYPQVEEAIIQIP